MLRLASPRITVVNPIQFVTHLLDSFLKVAFFLDIWLQCLCTIHIGSINGGAEEY